MEIQWNTATRRTWESATVSAAWQQGWAYGEAWRELYGPVHRAEIVQDGQTIGLAQFTARRFFGHLHAATCTRGPVWLTETSSQTRVESYNLLRQLIPLPRLRGVFITPDRGPDESEALSAARFRRGMTPYSTAVIDLTAKEEILRQAMQGKWRNRLKCAEDAGLKIAPAAPAIGQYDWLLEAEAVQQRQRRYLSAQPALTSGWHNQCSKTSSVMILTAKNATKRVAAMLFLVHGKGALYHIGWAEGAGRAMNAHNLILWRAMQKLKRNGVETLDLGGVDTVENAGIARFKLGSGGTVKTLCGTWY